jgi:hypothetical protein
MRSDIIRIPENARGNALMIYTIQGKLAARIAIDGRTGIHLNREAAFLPQTTLLVKIK